MHKCRGQGQYTAWRQARVACWKSPFFFFFSEGSSLSISELAGCFPEDPFEEDSQYFSMICVSNRDPKDSE